MIYRFCFPLLFILLVSCSTAPQRPEMVTEKKNQAVEFTKYGIDYFNQGLYDRALESFFRALQYNISVDNEQGIAISYNAIGSVYMARGDYEEAMNYFNKANELAKKLNNPVLLAQTANKIGEVYLNTGNIEKSKELFMEALHYENSGIPDEDLAILYHNIGSVQKRLNMNDQALVYIEKARVINLKLKRYDELAANYYMLASIYSEKGLYDKAVENAQQALEYDKKMENTLGIAKDFLALGIIFDKQGKHAEAYNYFKKTYLIYQALIVLYPTLSLDLEFKTILTHLLSVSTELGFQTEVTQYKKALDYIEQRLKQ